MTYKQWRVALWEAAIPEFHPIEWQDWLVSTGQGQFWATEDGAMITRIVTYPSGVKVLDPHAAAGNINAVLGELKPFIEDWARARGCKYVRPAGREGWRKTMPDYRHHQTVLIKEL